MADIIDLIIKSKEAPKEKNVLWLDTNDYTTKIYGNGGWKPLGGKGGGGEGVTIDLGSISMDSPTDVTDRMPEGYTPSSNDVVKFSFQGTELAATGFSIIDLGFGMGWRMVAGDSHIGLTLNYNDGEWTANFTFSIT